MKSTHIIPVLVIAALTATGGIARAETPTDFLNAYQSEARLAASGFTPSEKRGEALFSAVGTKDWSCSTCHTRNPADPGKHATTGKAIQPIAPGANRERLTNPRTVEKWFTRNCRDVLGRVCSAAEKADVVAYLISIKP
jgi:cytochrome c peroxidase